MAAAWYSALPNCVPVRNAMPKANRTTARTRSGGERPAIIRKACQVELLLVCLREMLCAVCCAMAAH